MGVKQWPGNIRKAEKNARCPSLPTVTCCVMMKRLSQEEVRSLRAIPTVKFYPETAGASLEMLLEICAKAFDSVERKYKGDERRIAEGQRTHSMRVSF